MWILRVCENASLGGFIWSFRLRNTILGVPGRICCSAINGKEAQADHGVANI